MYTRILVPLDGSSLAEQVLPYARLLGQSLQAPIELLRAVDPWSPVLFGPADHSYMDRVAAGMKTEATEYLDRVVASLRDTGLAISASTPDGDSATQIISAANKQPGTIITMTTHGRSGATRWLLGSVADRVLHTTSSPLLVVRAQPQHVATPPLALKSIIVPVDGSPEAEQVLPHVVALTRALALKVVLVRAAPTFVEHYAYAQDYNYVSLPAPVREDLAKEVDAEATDYLRSVAAKLRQQGATSVEEHLLHGNPGDAVIDFAQEASDSLVAMTTHGRSGVGRWVMGSVTERIVRYSKRPVLVVRAVGIKA